MYVWSLCAIRLRDYVESIIIVYVEFLLEINMRILCWLEKVCICRVCGGENICMWSDM